MIKPELMLIASMLRDDTGRVITEAVEHGISHGDYLDSDLGRAHAAMVEIWRKDQRPAPADLINATSGRITAQTIREAYAVIRTDRAGEYIQAVSTASTQRQIHAAINQANLRMSDGEPGAEVFAWLTNEHVRISGHGRGRFEHLHEVGLRNLQQYKAAQEHGFQGVRSPFRHLDRILGGYPPGMHILAARPKIGKSSMAGAEVFLMARKGIPVFAASLEMSASAMADRYVAHATQRDIAPLKDGTAAPEHIKSAAAHIEDFKRLPIHFATGNRITLSELILDIRAAKVKFGAAFVLVDHIGKITPDKSSRSQYDKITEFSNRLSSEAHNIGIPIRVVCHVGRQGEGKGSGKITMADLRESGHLEQDAESITILNREEGSHHTSCDVVANRNGSTGETHFAARLATHTWADLGPKNEGAEHDQDG
jgi:replicative DNA helicase